MLKIELLPAYYGDCILITFKDCNEIVRNILIDGGIARVYPKYLKPRLQKVKEDNQNIDLLIVTHIDDDHINGVVKLFEDSKFDKKFIKKIWFNSEININKKYSEIIDNPDEISIQDNMNTQTSTQKAYTLERKLRDLKCWEEKIVEVNDDFKKINFYGTEITILSPNFKGIQALSKKLKREKQKETHTASNDTDYSKTISELLSNNFKEDGSDTNKSSIAFLLQYDKKNYLFLADAHPTDIVESLENLGYCSEQKIKIEYVKLSHHASKGNINNQLLDIIECKKFIVSSNGSRHGLPHKEAIARILNYDKESKIYFNYDIYGDIFSDEEILKYKFYFKREFEV